MFTGEAHLFPSETDYIHEDSIPALPADEVLDFSSVRFSDSASTDPTYELPVNNEDLKENAAYSYLAENLQTHEITDFCRFLYSSSNFPWQSESFDLEGSLFLP